jgi:hypothetical protein
MRQAAWLEPSLWNQMPTLWSIHSSYSVIWSIVCMAMAFVLLVISDQLCLWKECGSQHPQQDVISSLFCAMAYWSQQFETIVFVSFLSRPKSSLSTGALSIKLWLDKQFGTRHKSWCITSCCGPKSHWEQRFWSKINDLPGFVCTICLQYNPCEKWSRL